MTELGQIHNITSIVSSYSLENMVETGCYEGDGIQTALDLGIQRVWSCDISERYVTHCKKRFQGQPVTILLGLSTDVLPSICSSVEGPTLFWLDAHLPSYYGITGTDEKHKMPVVQELNIIREYKRGIDKDVIIVDDTRIIASADNPRFSRGECLPEHLVTDVTLSEIQGVMKGTHRVEHYMNYQGYLLFTP
ncbi:MAG: hypothetical protein D6698_16575 [Gammaproteobacteria bacterium]|nr:MAG: hypothetical protein D6698_16575 [Gammaproteobacteria bacterium]